MRVLFVDDETRILEELAELAHFFNCECVIVNNVDSAILELTKNPNFDKIFTDWKMPGKNGLDFINEIKTQFAQHSFPIYIVSGHIDTDFDHRSFGAVGFVRKPIILAELAPLLT